MVPDPFCTAQVWALLGVPTVTLYFPPLGTAVGSVKEPFAAIGTSADPLRTCTVALVPRPISIPPTVWGVGPLEARSATAELFATFVPAGGFSLITSPEATLLLH